MKRGEKSRLRMEIKEISEGGAFEGMLSPYGNVDEGRDVVERGAYAKTLKEHGTEVPLLWQHKTDQPIGKLFLEDRPEGLWCKGQLVMDLPRAKEAYILMKARICRGLSIGFQAIKDEVVNGIRHLKEVRLFEGSVVTFPMNELAQIVSVKQREDKAGDPAAICTALCRICAETCEQTVYYLYRQEQYDDPLIVTIADCMAGCEVCSSALYRESPSTADFAALCQTVARRCAEACSGSDDAVLQACADACDACADACGELGPSPAEAPEKAIEGLETKAGRTISAATSKSIRAACDKIRSGHDEMMALAGEAAEEEGTSSDDAAVKARAGESHSATEPPAAVGQESRELLDLVESMRALIPA